MELFLGAFPCEPGGKVRLRGGDDARVRREPFRAGGGDRACRERFPECEKRENACRALSAVFDGSAGISGFEHACGVRQCFGNADGRLCRCGGAFLYHIEQAGDFKRDADDPDGDGVDLLPVCAFAQYAHDGDSGCVKKASCPGGTDRADA